MVRRKRFHVCVVELFSDVLLSTRFMHSNPDYLLKKPCVHIGMTGLDPDVRFDECKAGIQANRYVQEYGQRLLPKIYELYNPLTYDEARSLEVKLSIDLREGKFGVWQASIQMAAGCNSSNCFFQHAGGLRLLIFASV